MAGRGKTIRKAHHEERGQAAGGDPQQSAESGDHGEAGLASQIAFVLLSHLLFVLLVGGVLLVAIPVANFAHQLLGTLAGLAAGLALIVSYQRVAAIPARFVARGDDGVQARLPESYVAGLAICHFAALFVLLDVGDGSFWLYRQQVTDLPTMDALPPDKPEGVYRIEDATAVTSVRYRQYGTRSPQSTQAARYSQTDTRTAWDVMPLVSGAPSQEEVEAAVSSGHQCIWLGSKGGSELIVDRLSVDDDSDFYIERNSRRAAKYINALEARLGPATLPACTRILEKMPSPDVVQQTYLRWALSALGLAHAIPALLLVVFYWFSTDRRRNRDAT